MRKLLSVLGLVVTLGCVQAMFALPSSADTLTAVVPFSGNLLVVAAQGKANNITISTDAQGAALVSDTGDLVRADGGDCLQVTPHQVRCTGFLVVVQITAGDMDDTITNNSAIPTQMRGEAGRDVFRGGSSSDGMYGGPGDDTAFGNGGDDFFQADGIDGRDTFSGGPGSDAAIYNTRGSAQTITLDGVANDGLAGEGDNVGSDVEKVFSGSGADRITGNSAANEIRGGDGDDVINAVDGIGGNDTISAAGGTDTCNSDRGDLEFDCEI